MEDLKKLIKEIANPNSDFHKNNSTSFKVEYLEEYFEKLSLPIISEKTKQIGGTSINPMRYDEKFQLSKLIGDAW